MRRRLSKLVRRRFENQALVILSIVGEISCGFLRLLVWEIVGVDWFCRWTIIGIDFQSLQVLFIRRLGLRIVVSIPYLANISSLSFLIFRTLEHYSAVSFSAISRRFRWLFCSLRGRAVIPHSYLPAGIVATMSRVVNYHSSWARQQQVELFDASAPLWVELSVFFGVSCIAPAFYSLLFNSVVLLLSVLGFNPMSLRGLVCFFVALFSGNPGPTAGRGFNPAGGAPGGG
ncbi:hypothetical protein F511_29045 [Dorcoceras hygrometricum]|uniref:Uncharacterized protein n=1 Tax=Dorcoceras hygrometricum TaxID=472368 RepID=A0A2Z7CHK9_9LAMI|nr:hypothetical protein F511_29045 [Dorcoceras hygrometricum]